MSLIKALILYVFLLGETVFLCNLTESYITSQKYLTLEILPILVLILGATIILWTFSLTIGLWKYWWSLSLAPLIICAGILIYSLSTSLIFIIPLVILILLVAVMNSYRSYMVKGNLVKFEPTFILRPANKSILLALSLVAGIISYSKPDLISKLNIGEKISQNVTGQMKTLLEQQLNNQVQTQFESLKITGVDLKDPDTMKLLKDAGLTEYMSVTPVSNKINVNVNNVIETQINNFIDPYKNYLAPGIAVLIFLVFYSFYYFSYGIYVLTVGIIFALAKWTGFLKVETITIEQELLTF